MTTRAIGSAVRWTCLRICREARSASLNSRILINILRRILGGFLLSLRRSRRNNRESFRPDPLILRRAIRRLRLPLRFARAPVTFFRSFVCNHCLATVLSI